MKRNTVCCFSVAAAACLIIGCASQGLRNPSGVPVTGTKGDERGFVANPGVESQDIATVADKMAREILNTPEIANAKAVPRIVILPVKNLTSLPINKDVFNERLTTLLNEKSSGKVRFLARDRITDLDKQPDLVLTGRLTETTARASNAPSDYVLCSYTLTDPHTYDIVCQKSHEIKKQGLEGVFYR